MKGGVAAGLHPLTWASWLGTALAVISLTRNPFYLLVLLLGLALAAERLRTPGRAAPFDPIVFAAIAVGFGGAFNALTTRYGDTVLARLPEQWLLIGGPITAEALVYGITNGLVLGALVAAFAVFGVALPVGALLRLAPRAFYPLAVVITIAVTYVPLTLRHAGQVREAQRLRGHQLRTWRDSLPLLLPLLIGGLERALQLAEALAARGFAADPPPAYTRTLLAGGLGAIFGGLLLRFAWGQAGWGWLVLGGGAGLVVAALVFAGRNVPRTHYQQHTWSRRDGAVLAGAALALAVMLLPWDAQASIFFTPYPTLQLPAFEPLLALGLLGLLAPLGLDTLQNVERRIQNEHVHDSD
jgi:energy-coupling factor transport system permease protein